MRGRLSLLTGGIAGLLYAALLVITYRLGIPAMANFLNLFTWTPLVLIPVAAGAWWLRKNEVPAPDFRALMKYALLAYLVFELIYAVATYGLFSWHDPAANDKLLQHLLDEKLRQLADQKADPSRIKAIEEMADSAKGTVGLKQVVLGFGQNLILDFFKSLLIASITKQTVQPKA